jgi:hypothetical protein
MSEPRYSVIGLSVMLQDGNIQAYLTGAIAAFGQVVVKLSKELGSKKVEGWTCSSVVEHLAVMH